MKLKNSPVVVVFQAYGIGFDFSGLHLKMWWDCKPLLFQCEKVS